MQSLRLPQRKVLQQLFHELAASNTNGDQLLTHQRRLLHDASFMKSTRQQNVTSQPGQASRTSRLQSPLLRSHNSCPQHRNPFSPRTFFIRSRPQQHLQRPRKHRPYSSSSSTASSTPEPTTLSGRLKKLSREYGWSALGIYLALSALDFPFCFLAVRAFGTERIGHLEHVVVSYAKEALKTPLAMMGWDQEAAKVDEGSQMVKNEVSDGLERVGDASVGGGRLLEEGTHQQEGGGVVKGVKEAWDDHGVLEAEKANTGDGASIWTQLALAYAIHKSFIFIRVPLTAAVTPKVVKTLRGWGWNIGKRTPKKAAGVEGVGVVAQKGTGVNTGATGTGIGKGSS